MLISEPEIVYNLTESVLHSGQYVHNYKKELRVIMIFTSKDIVVSLLNGFPYEIIKKQISVLSCNFFLKRLNYRLKKYRRIQNLLFFSLI